MVPDLHEVHVEFKLFGLVQDSWLGEGVLIPLYLWNSYPDPVGISVAFLRSLQAPNGPMSVP